MLHFLLLCRFYFVSDPTLLEILSLGSDPPSVVPHFQSGLFDSLTNVTFDKVDKTKMLEMFSQQGEKVRHCTCISSCYGGVCGRRDVCNCSMCKVHVCACEDAAAQSLATNLPFQC